jgi:hypothetical protein
MKKIPTLWWIIGFIVIIVGLLGWSRLIQSSNPNTVSTGAFHWHPELTIYVKGEKQEIPQGIGLAGAHKPIHTHDDIPVIHMEFVGAAKKEETTLGMFFRNWGKDFNSFGSSVTMTVNGKENTEFENYQMKDGDKIELHYK